MRERRALRQFTLSTGKSAGRNSSGRITLFHRGGGSKRLQRRIDLKRSTSSMGIVERIEYDPNRSSRIAPVRWKGGGGPPEKMQHDRRVRSAEKETRIYHDHRPRAICVLFPAREGGSKKGSLLLSWTDGGLCSGRPSYQNAFLVEEPLD